MQFPAKNHWNRNCNQHYSTAHSSNLPFNIRNTESADKHKLKHNPFPVCYSFPFVDGFTGAVAIMQLFIIAGELKREIKINYTCTDGGIIYVSAQTKFLCCLPNLLPVLLLSHDLGLCRSDEIYDSISI